MRYAVLFRALNIGGKNAVRMAELSQMLSTLGFDAARTFLQSGNAAVRSELAELELTERIQSAFRERFGFDSVVMARSETDLNATLTGMPFSEAELSRAQAADPAVEHLYVYFLPQDVAAEQLAPLLCEDAQGDTVRAGGRALYLLCSQSVRLSKAAARIARAMPDATARNGNTVRRLHALLTEI